ncbi:hypothetical protein [Streptomyces noursei]|uniref:Uncharacterized protein n=1 Tax=Streptomyces noursei TaxID=1971 RepID=A0A2N8PR99_STRNR|nr:hypothetical protein [Streptomyces noursei]PNE43509.1 hypothetical protein AOB60_00960 [Streptomyces noursei]
MTPTQMAEASVVAIGVDFQQTWTTRADRRVGNAAADLVREHSVPAVLDDVVDTALRSGSPPPLWVARRP